MKTCQWIEGGGGGKPATFCEKPAEVGKSYCAEHALRVYTPKNAPKPKTDKTQSKRKGMW